VTLSQTPNAVRPSTFVGFNGHHPMPINRIVKETALGQEGAVFDPEEVKAIVAAYEAALVRLGLKDRSDPMAEMVAKKTVEFAKAGERSPVRLTELVVTALQE
jgi:hypothetical protein